LLFFSIRTTGGGKVTTSAITPRVHRPGWSISLGILISLTQSFITLAKDGRELTVRGESTLREARDLLVKYIALSEIDMSVRNTLGSLEESIRVLDLWDKRFPSIETQPEFTEHLRSILSEFDRFMETGSDESADKVLEFFDAVVDWIERDVPKPYPRDDGWHY